MGILSKLAKYTKKESKNGNLGECHRTIVTDFTLVHFVGRLTGESSHRQGGVFGAGAGNNCRSACISLLTESKNKSNKFCQQGLWLLFRKISINLCPSL